MCNTGRRLAATSSPSYLLSLLQLQLHYQHFHHHWQHQVNIITCHKPSECHPKKALSTSTIPSYIYCHLQHIQHQQHHRHDDHNPPLVRPAIKINIKIKININVNINIVMMIIIPPTVRPTSKRLSGEQPNKSHRWKSLL